MNTPALALRNLLRNRRRSLATLLSMSIGAVSLLLFGGYVRNIVYGMQTGFVRGGGHLQLQHRDYFLYGSGDPTAYGIADYQRVIDIIKHDTVLAPMLTVVTPTLEFGGIAGNFTAGVSRTVIASGAVVDDQNAMNLWNDYGFPANSGPLPLTGTSTDSVVIGTGVARVLKLCASLNVSNCPQPSKAAEPAGPELPQDIAQLGMSDDLQSGATVRANSPSQVSRAPIELLAATTSGAPNVTRLNVIKAEDQGVKQLDDIYVSLHLSQAQRLLYGRTAPEVTAIDLQLRHTAQIPAAVARLKQLLQSSLRNQPLSIYDFRELNPYYGQTIGMLNAIFGFIATLIGAIALFTVGNTMNAAVVERTVEIGTLRAIGLRRAGVRRLFVGEAVLLGAIGATLGVLAAIALAELINHSGITWTPPGRTEPIHLNIRLWGETAMLTGTAAGLMLVAVVSAWWPASRAAKLQVVEALRHV
jgi:putative ABC transport system permease protein